MHQAIINTVNTRDIHRKWIQKLNRYSPFKISVTLLYSPIGGEFFHSKKKIRIKIFFPLQHEPSFLTGTWQAGQYIRKNRNFKVKQNQM